MLPLCPEPPECCLQGWAATGTAEMRVLWNEPPEGQEHPGSVERLGELLSLERRGSKGTDPWGWMSGGE